MSPVDTSPSSRLIKNDAWKTQKYSIMNECLPGLLIPVFVLITNINIGEEPINGTISPSIASHHHH